MSDEFAPTPEERAQRRAYVAGLKASKPSAEDSYQEKLAKAQLLHNGLWHQLVKILAALPEGESGPRFEAICDAFQSVKSLGRELADAEEPDEDRQERIAHLYGEVQPCCGRRAADCSCASKPKQIDHPCPSCDRQDEHGNWFSPCPSEDCPQSEWFDPTPDSPDMLRLGSRVGNSYFNNTTTRIVTDPVA